MLGFECLDRSEYEAHRVTRAQLREPLWSHGLGADSTITTKSHPGQGWDNMPQSRKPACGYLVGSWDCVWPRSANGKQNHLPLSKGKRGVKVAWVGWEEEPAAGPVWGITPGQPCVACSFLELSQP